MENMKNFEKLNFFYRSNLDQIPFGSYIYRKHDEITHIYYLVKGEIQISKSIDEK
jgi:CRP-like cAMP-binding protein